MAEELGKTGGFPLAPFPAYREGTERTYAYEVFSETGRGGGGADFSHRGRGGDWAGQEEPDTGGQASTAIVGSYTYVYDYAGVLTDETMEHIDAMNASLFAQTGAQILVSVVNSTGGADIMDYASDLGNSYGVGSAERNNGVVMLLALDNISQSGLMGDYCVVVGTGLESHADDFMSLQSYYLENDFAAGEYDAGVKATFDAFIAWFADLYGVTIREGYIPAVRETYSSGSGYYYTETHGYVAPAFGSLVSGVVVLLVVLLVLWVILDGMRYSRYRRRYLRPGMGRPTVLYYPIFWGRPQRPRPPRPPRPPKPPRRPPSGGTFGGVGFGGSRGGMFGGGSFGSAGGSRGSLGGGTFRGSGGRRGGFGGGSFRSGGRR